MWSFGEQDWKTETWLIFWNLEHSHTFQTWSSTMLSQRDQEIQFRSGSLAGDKMKRQWYPGSSRHDYILRKM